MQVRRVRPHKPAIAVKRTRKVELYVSPEVYHPEVAAGEHRMVADMVDGLESNMLIPFYLMLSYLYYDRDLSGVPDSEFDKLCNRLQNEWDSITHEHKQYVNREALAAGTGYHLKYTNRIRGAAVAWFNDNCITRRRRRVC